MKAETKQQIADALKDFRLPRYNEIPNVGLYLEQATKYVCEYLAPLGDYTLTFQELGEGTVDIALIPIPSEYDPRLEMNFIPYLFNGYDGLQDGFGEGSYFFEKYTEIMGELNIKLLGMYVEGMIGFGFVPEPVGYNDVNVDKGLMVRAPAIEAQLIETYLLLCINHQSLIATKANRVVRAAQGRAVLEFGSRRAQGPDGAMLGARAAYIGGCHGTACTISDQLFGVKASGTMAHAWVQMFDTELEAFKAYCEMYPNNATLLVDTYNTLKSGVPNAIRAFNEVLKPLGITKCGIRLDSGDMAYLTQKARQMLDEAGWTECKISVSNSLDEHIIQAILRQGAQIDMFGVGDKGMWNINKAFLNQQISAGSTFALANNPVTSGGYYFMKEVAYLASKGISMLPIF